MNRRVKQVLVYSAFGGSVVLLLLSFGGLAGLGESYDDHRVNWAPFGPCVVASLSTHTFRNVRNGVFVRPIRARSLYNRTPFSILSLLSVCV